MFWPTFILKAISTTGYWWHNNVLEPVGPWDINGHYPRALPGLAYPQWEALHSKLMIGCNMSQPLFMQTSMNVFDTERRHRIVGGMHSSCPSPFDDGRCKHFGGYRETSPPQPGVRSREFIKTRTSKTHVSTSLDISWHRHFQTLFSALKAHFELKTARELLQAPWKVNSQHTCTTTKRWTDKGMGFRNASPSLCG